MTRAIASVWLRVLRSFTRTCSKFSSVVRKDRVRERGIDDHFGSLNGLFLSNYPQIDSPGRAQYPSSISEWREPSHRSPFRPLIPPCSQCDTAGDEMLALELSNGESAMPNRETSAATHEAVLQYEQSGRELNLRVDILPLNKTRSGSVFIR